MIAVTMGDPAGDWSGDYYQIPRRGGAERRAGGGGGLRADACGGSWR